MVPRESPLSALHLQNLADAARLGATVIPPEPAFYLEQETMGDVAAFVTQRVLLALGVIDALPEEMQYRAGASRPSGSHLTGCGNPGSARGVELLSRGLRSLRYKCPENSHRAPESRGTMLQIRPLFELLYPLVEEWAFLADGAETDFFCGQDTHQRLLITAVQFLDPTGRGGLR